MKVSNKIHYFPLLITLIISYSYAANCQAIRDFGIKAGYKYAYQQENLIFSFDYDDLYRVV
jgi:hypothetical protein